MENIDDLLGPAQSHAKNQTAIDYAQERADATGRAYVVTNMGHAFMRAGNLKLAALCGGVATVCRRRIAKKVTS